MNEIVRFNYRLRVGREAEDTLLSEWGRCRWLWNEAVHQQRSGRRPTLKMLSGLLTEARSQNRWLREGSQNAQQGSLYDYAKALNHSFTVKGRGRPTIKKFKSSTPSVGFTGKNFLIREGRLKLPKMPPIPVVWHRPLPSEPTSVRVFQDSLGHWYASFVVRRGAEDLPPADKSIGIDWGVTETATTTDPAFDLPHAQHRKMCAAQLARAQRKMARRRRQGRQSNGYKRAKREAAKVHKKAARQVQHDARNWAKAVVGNHDLIAVEDFKPKFLARSTMAKKAADAAIGATKRELIERGIRAGRKVVLVQPEYTTMTCSRCFARTKQRLDLSKRTFRCEACDFVAGRDQNAARVILDVAEQNHTSVDDVRRDPDALARLASRSELETVEV